MDRCASCDADDELLFTCGHCGDQFCVGHQFPHHTCHSFRSGGEEPKSASRLSDESADTAGAARPDSRTDATAAARIEEGVARDAAKAMRPDREGTPGPPPGQGMPWERGSEGVGDWMRAQSYPAYLLKVGGLSLLLMTAYYVGLAAMLYGRL